MIISKVIVSHLFVCPRGVGGVGGWGVGAGRGSHRCNSSPCFAKTCSRKSARSAKLNKEIIRERAVEEPARFGRPSGAFCFVLLWFLVALTASSSTLTLNYWSSESKTTLAKPLQASSSVIMPRWTWKKHFFFPLSHSRQHCLSLLQRLKVFLWFSFNLSFLFFVANKGRANEMNS